MLRGIRIFAIFAFAIIIGYSAGELKATPSTEQGTGLTVLLLVSVSVLVAMGLLEARHLRQPNKKKHRFESSHHQNDAVIRAGESGHSSFYSARPHDEAWQVRKHSSKHQRRSKSRKNSR